VKEKLTKVRSADQNVRFAGAIGNALVEHMFSVLARKADMRGHARAAEGESSR